MAHPDATAGSDGPELPGAQIEAREFLKESQGTDYELVIDGWHYCFSDDAPQDLEEAEADLENGGGELRLIWFGRYEAEDLTGHPDLHECRVPDELLDLFARSQLIQLSDGVPIDDQQPIDLTGSTVADNGRQMVEIDDPDRPQQTVKAADTIVRELALGHSRLEPTADSGNGGSA